MRSRLARASTISPLGKQRKLLSIRRLLCVIYTCLPLRSHDHVNVGRPGGFLQAITHGYGGAALHDDVLMLRPSLPENSNFLKLRRFSYQGEFQCVISLAFFSM